MCWKWKVATSTKLTHWSYYMWLELYLQDANLSYHRDPGLKHFNDFFLFGVRDVNLYSSPGHTGPAWSVSKTPPSSLSCNPTDSSISRNPWSLWLQTLCKSNSFHQEVSFHIPTFFCFSSIQSTEVIAFSKAGWFIWVRYLPPLTCFCSSSSW